MGRRREITFPSGSLIKNKKRKRKIKRIKYCRSFVFSSSVCTYFTSAANVRFELEKRIIKNCFVDILGAYFEFQAKCVREMKLKCSSTYWIFKYQPKWHSEWEDCNTRCFTKITLAFLRTFFFSVYYQKLVTVDEKKERKKSSLCRYIFWGNSSAFVQLILFFHSVF